jgi:hypothetical protein
MGGVDGLDLRRAFPNVCLVGHFDKMVMDKVILKVKAKAVKVIKMAMVTKVAVMEMRKVMISTVHMVRILKTKKKLSILGH